jgi:hypothetical protein
VQQLRHVGERQRGEVDGPGVQRQDDGLAVAQQDTEIASVRCVAGEGYDLRLTARQAARRKIAIDLFT